MLGRGLAAIGFGLLALLAPRLSLLALVLTFGTFAFADGLLALGNAVLRRAGGPPWWLLALGGVVGIGAGVFTFLAPGITAITLALVVGAWALVTGMLQILVALRLRMSIDGEWLLGLAGVLSIALGLLLVWNPGAAILALMLWIGAYALALGGALVALALRLRSLRKQELDIQWDSPLRRAP